MEQIEVFSQNPREEETIRNIFKLRVWTRPTFVDTHKNLFSPRAASANSNSRVDRTVARGVLICCF